MRRVAAAFAIAFLLVGCDDPAPSPKSQSETAERPASWDDLVAAVRAGADKIRTSEPVTAEQFGTLATGCDGLTAIVLEGTASLADDDLAVLSSLPKLRWLKLPSPIGDAGAESIAGCESLEIVNLPNGSFSDAGLAKLASLERLELLRFGSPNVTDEGLKELARLPRLKFLHLLDVPITDDGLKHVAAVESLESFYLDGGNATDDGLRRLLADRPDLHFHKDQHHLPGDPNAHRHE